MDFKILIEKYDNEINSNIKKEIDKDIWVRFGQKSAVLVIDMSGFTKTVKKYGIVHYLSMIYNMNKIVEKTVKETYGRVIKFEADDAFVVFKVPSNALKCTLELNKRFNDYNSTVDRSSHINIKCGLDYGDCLFPTENDFFGDVVNVASKLGEDIATKGQILISNNFAKEIEIMYKKLTKKEQKFIEVVDVNPT
ncbi:MAG: adenylate/guanylate cyclase domain-containing protein [Arcobacteraceae bacterium]|nr:adenylate/guanylate cyclase domain-containing protein [Arcobacteraceae bacterium]